MLIGMRRGYTLIEILLVVAIIAILAGIVIIAINPAKQLADTRNSQRRVDVQTISNALYQYTLDNSGDFPSGIDNILNTSQVLGTATGCNTTCTATSTVTSCLDLSSSLVPTYVVDIPMDPKTGTSTNSDYFINITADDRLVVGACEPERDASIVIER
jgi:prepilin-type N-terminal cleavage/methylation domain-containing protein